MNIFDIHSNITGTNEEYIRSIVNISDERMRQQGKIYKAVDEPLDTQLPVIHEVPERRILPQKIQPTPQKTKNSNTTQQTLGSQPKTRHSDPEAPAKHNALVAFMEQENASNTSRKLIGGIAIPDTVGENIHWRYCRNRIEDTGDLTGWEFLNPKSITS
jgi:hypothetical protein